MLVQMHDGRVEFRVVADQEPQVDIWGAERRTDLFEKVFGLPVAVRWADAAADAAPPDPPAAEKAKPRKPARRAGGRGRPKVDDAAAARGNAAAEKPDA